MTQKLLLVKYLERFRLAVAKGGKHSWKPSPFDELEDAESEENSEQ